MDRIKEVKVRKKRFEIGWLWIPSKTETNPYHWVLYDMVENENEDECVEIWLRQDDK